MLRSAVNCTALWNLKVRLYKSDPGKKLLLFYDDGKKIKIVIK